MKTNYHFKPPTQRLVFFVVILSALCVKAQVSTEYTNIPLRLDEGTYTGTILVKTDPIQVEGVEFTIQAEIVPSGTSIVSNANRRWGVDDANLDGANSESVTISNLTVQDFNDNGTGYTAAAISNLRFYSVALFNMHNSSDVPRITVDGANGGTTDIQGPFTRTQTIVFGTSFDNVADPVVSYTIGGDDVTSITLAHATTEAANNFQVVSTPVAYTFTTDPGLSVVNKVAKNSELKLYPNPVKNNIALNIPIHSAEILSITGKLVKAFSESSTTLNVSGLAPGMYILRGISEEGVPLVKRFVK